MAEKELRPLLGNSDGVEAFTRQALSRLAKAGFLGGVFPQEFGGAGMDYGSYTRICEAIGGVSPSLFTSRRAGRSRHSAIVKILQSCRVGSSPIFFDGSSATCTLLAKRV